ncbi:endonuclease V [Bacillus wiedmannii]|uniref:endonuclease V n=1 Tax=Bacillus wiedmannii TaxID=1890302 RepID=UPI000BFB319C|nr:endonuclease V [Bacillus wiedmannii]PGZ97871.1 endonuclease V [Bacillus wiedmannii]
MKNLDLNNMKLINEFTDIQNELLFKVNLENRFDVNEIKTIAGIDLAYWDVNNKTYGTCCIVMIDYYTKEVVEKVYSYGEISIPYISGFLAFRELPLILEAAKKLSNEPDLYMFDGNGYLHYRHMGIATHAAMYLNKPTIGVAKSYLKIENVDATMPKEEVGSYTDIVIHGDIYGRVLRTSYCVKPIFVSCGNWIDLDTSTEVVMNCINNESRLPIPVRLADLETHKMRKKLMEG